MRRILVGISGASGAPIAIRLLQRLKEMSDVETHLVMTRGAKLTIEQETEATVDQVKKLADVVYENEEIGSRPASGSFSIDAMIIVPCSMKTVAGIAGGYSDNLLLRAADVVIKEARPLFLVARESPLSPIHLRNLQELSMMGFDNSGAESRTIQKLIIQFFVGTEIRLYASQKQLECRNIRRRSMHFR